LDETINLWAYVERPTGAGTYQLSIEANIPMPRFHMEPDAMLWSGQIRSNVLDVKFTQ
jgi:hypothetical protein